MPRKKTTEELVGERVAFAKATAHQDRTPINIIADNIRSLDNVGLLFRLCELIRAEHLYLTGYTGYPGQSERHTQRIGKTSVYAIPHQPWSHIEDPIPLVHKLKQAGNKIIALEQTDKSVPYNKLLLTDYYLPLTLILGHEREGVRQELLDLADAIIEIPILGLGNSHNVTISAGIVLYHILAKTGKLG
ncbi:MAG TPA: TrmH family RNA methyltransferase [Candidatus Andersenbacteria bacterium]|nr:TrmH family RNA methyltransferase [Candidatus Andersenbacteria bacterium]